MHELSARGTQPADSAIAHASCDLSYYSVHNRIQVDYPSTQSKNLDGESLLGLGDACVDSVMPLDDACQLVLTK